MYKLLMSILWFCFSKGFTSYNFLADKKAWHNDELSRV